MNFEETKRAANLMRTLRRIRDRGVKGKNYFATIVLHANHHTDIYLNRKKIFDFLNILFAPDLDVPTFCALVASGLCDDVLDILLGMFSVAVDYSKILEYAEQDLSDGKITEGQYLEQCDWLGWLGRIRTKWLDTYDCCEVGTRKPAFSEHIV